MIELAANEDYFRGRPRIDRVVLRFGPPAATELLAGNADILQEVGEADILTIYRDHSDRFRLRHMISPDAVNAIVWNQRRPPNGPLALAIIAAVFWKSCQTHPQDALANGMREMTRAPKMGEAKSDKTPRPRATARRGLGPPGRVFQGYTRIWRVGAAIALAVNAGRVTLAGGG